MIGFHALRPFFPVFRLLHPCRTAHNLNEIMTSFWLPTLRNITAEWVCIIMWKKGRFQASLIGTLEPPVTPTCLNSNGVNHIVHGLFVLSAIGFKRNDHHCL
ncbi:hypothetical protein Y032_0251g175 [Ancylostoma ceylanicum]|uniref:Uncharacterized protein n=1 Tax=Ancylostoma ceylanicum TaxID=53326 RepID=A0A016SD02_9BILA|nr:hypothetical protein Y032_0251g175 [Ancylostoma ceylanicum]